jgi:UPF0716 protein FxsA
MPLILLLLAVCWPIAEIFVAIKVADAIGVLLTLLLLFAGWPLGRWALRSQGRAAWRRLNAAVQAGRPPGREALDGALVVAGGVLLMIPGFISDALGVLALLPPCRALTRRVLMRLIKSRLVVRASRFARVSYDVDSTARDLEQPQLPS